VLASFVPLEKLDCAHVVGPLVEISVAVFAAESVLRAALIQTGASTIRLY